MQKETKHHRGRRDKKKKFDIVSFIILLFATGVFLFSAYKLYEIYAEYKAGEDEYEGIKEIVIKEEPKEEETETEEEPSFSVDFDTLLGMNPDVVGWIRFEEPSPINYPMVQGIDNNQYLRTTLEHKKNIAGTIFIDVDNTPDFNDRNTFIYGHNMKNRSMFGSLREYKKQAYCEQNPYFYIYTPDGREITYQIFAVCVVTDTSPSYRKAYADDADFAEYIDSIRKISRYSTDVQVDGGSQIVSLSTCTNVREEERLLVHAVKINERTVE